MGFFLGRIQIRIRPIISRNGSADPDPDLNPDQNAKEHWLKLNKDSFYSPSQLKYPGELEDPEDLEYPLEARLLLFPRRTFKGGVSSSQCSFSMIDK